VIRPSVVAIVGPTASGKTALGEAVAAAIGGEVVCADSRQVYAELEIGTGKPTPEERARLPHHLFDARRLGDAASAGWYAAACGQARRAIHPAHQPAAEHLAGLLAQLPLMGAPPLGTGQRVDPCRRRGVHDRHAVAVLEARGVGGAELPRHRTELHQALHPLRCGSC